MRRDEAVWITGVGTANPLGSSFEECADAFLAGRSGVRAVTDFDVSEHPSQVAAVVEALNTYNQGVNGQSTPMGYGAWAADILLPNVIRCTPGTTAFWDPWNGLRNGMGLYEERASNFAKMVVNQDYSTGLMQTEKLLDYFPYLLPPIPGT